MFTKRNATIGTFHAVTMLMFLACGLHAFVQGDNFSLIVFSILVILDGMSINHVLDLMVEESRK